MKQFKTLLAICMLSVLSFGPVYGQDLATATDLFNSGAVAFNTNNYASAIESFNKALGMLEGLGEEGAPMLKKCKDILPKVYLRYGRELASGREIDKAVLELQKAVESAKANSMDDIAKEASDLIPQFMLADATSFQNEGKLPEAIAGYKKLLVMEPNNSVAYMRIGMCESRLNNETGAIEAFDKAVLLGDKEAASQLSGIYLKKSVRAIAAKNWQAVYDNAKKSNQYVATAQGNKLLGTSAAELKKYDEAIAVFESYFAADPNASDKSNTIYYLALSYEGKKNIAKACGYFKQLLTDPTYKAFAEYKVKTQYKCK